jgi:hypothetical protein
MENSPYMRSCRGFEHKSKHTIALLLLIPFSITSEAALVHSAISELRMATMQEEQNHCFTSKISMADQVPPGCSQILQL